MTISQLLNILRARAGVILMTLLITMLAALGISLVMPKQYTAMASLVVDVKSLDPVAGTIAPGIFAPGYMSTQIDILNSERVSERVVKMLGLDKDEKSKAAWMEADKGEGDFVNWLAKGLQTKLDAKPSRDSNIIQVAYRGSNPKFVAAAANAFAQAYIDVDLALKIEPARQYAAWFEDQTLQARNTLEAAQARLSDYQQRNGIVSADERLDAENNKINDLTTQLTLVQAQIGEAQSKRESGNTGSTDAAMQSATISQLKSDITRLDARLQESNGNLGRNHPQTLRMQAELNSLRAQLNREVGQIATSFDTSLRIGRQREQQLQAALAAQKTKVLKLNKQRDENSVLRRDVESAQKDYETLSNRLSVTRLESRTSKTNISILSPATVPLSASKPKVLLNTIAGAAVGLMLGLAFAIALELANRRIRSVHDLAIALDVPVLARISSVKQVGKVGWRPRYLLPHSPATT